jgi:hypothetical protein
MLSPIKKLLFGIFTPLLLVILTSCIRVEGNLAIEPSGLVNGNLTYAIDMQLASLAGVKTLADLQKQASTQDELQSICTKFKWTETKSEYVGSCDLKDANLKEGDLLVKVEKDSIEFSFKSNLDAEESKSKEKDNSNQISDFGTTRLVINFPGEIKQVVENKKGLVTLVGKSQAIISGSGTEKFDIRLIASCSGICGQSMKETASKFKEAPKNFSGIVAENLRFSKKNSPYVVKKSIEIPKGKVVYVEPGVIFRSEFPKKNSWDKSSTFFLQGEIYFDGTKEQPISLLGAPNVHLLTSFAPKGAKLTAYNLNVIGGNTFTSNSGQEGYVNFKIYDSVFDGLSTYWHIWYPWGSNEISRNQFINTGFLDVGFRADENTSFLIKNNLFIGLPKKSSESPTCWIRSWASYGGKLQVTENDFSQSKSPAVCIGEGYDSAEINAINNFWGTVAKAEIKKKVIDGEDGLRYLSIIDSSSPLTKKPEAISTLRKYKK